MRRLWQSWVNAPNHQHPFGQICRNRRRVALAGAVLCKERHPKSYGGCCGVCFNDMWNALRSAKKHPDVTRAKYEVKLAKRRARNG